MRNAEDFNVEVFGRMLQQPIADEAADTQRASAGITNGRRDSRRLLFQVHTNSI